MKKKILNPFMMFLAPLMVLSAFTADAQIGETGYFNQGEKYFQAGRYYEAAQVFEKYIASEREAKSAGSPFAVEKKVKNMPRLNMHEEAIFALGECYRNYHDFVKAEKYYGLATKFKDNAYSLAWFWYGICLRANKKYPEAYKALNTFVAQYKKMGPILIRADQELESLKFIQAQLNRTDTSYAIRQQLINDSISACALSVVHGDTVAFTSIRMDSPVSKKATADYNIRLFESTLGGESFDLDHPIPMPDSPGIQNGMATFTDDGKVMFLTRWTVTRGKRHSAIYRSVMTDTGWAAPVPVQGPVNFGPYNSAQPFVTEGGKYLLYASDRTSGEGGWDLWYAQLDSNYNSFNALNMGNKINTPGDEQAPYYHRKTQTLVFSSNGRPGMGGFDIYYCQRGFDFMDWGEVRNPGIPINSVKDDLYFYSTDDINVWNSAWISSDRASECCLALFSVRENNSLTLTGSVLDSATHQPIGNAEVVITDPRRKGRLIATGSTDSLGHYRIESSNISSFHLDGHKTGYRSDTANLDVMLEVGANTATAPDLYLARLLTPRQRAQAQLKMLNSSNTLANFSFDKHDLDESAYPNLDSLVVLMQTVPDMVVEIGGYTDGKGTLKYNLKLAQARVDACMAYLLKKGIPAARLKTKAYGPCCPIEPETIGGKDNPAGRARNRRVEYKLLNPE